MPSPVLCPRNTKVNKADIAAVRMVCFLLPFFHSFMPQIYCVTTMCHALDWAVGNVKKNQCQSSQGKTGRLQYINIYSVIESA